MPNPLITLVNASAGTGKTYQLAQEYLKAIREELLAPSEIITVTFTKKAAAELLERIRGELLKAGESQAATQILHSPIGTVHSVCGQLLREWALEAGLSPKIKVIPEEEQDRWFNIAAAQSIEQYAQKLEPIALRLSHAGGGGESPLPEWRKVMRELVEQARANNLSPDQLKESAIHSYETLSPWFSCEIPKQESANLLDSQLETKLKQTLEQLRHTLHQNQGKSAKKGDLRALEELEEITHQIRHQNLSQLPWSVWVKLSKIEATKNTQPILEALNEVATKHLHHPRLHEDIQHFLQLIFECAATAMTLYQDFKREQGFLDFTDQEQLLLKLLEVPSIREQIQARFQLLLVDEFQDTSPIQLALFVKLAQLVAKRSWWVGDVKQAIYGFRGTDSQLIDQVLHYLSAGEKSQENESIILTQSYRTRETLVALTNRLFAESFPSYGIEKERVIISEVHRQDEDQLGPPLALWWLADSRKEHRSYAIAQGIANLLASAHHYPVTAKGEISPRPLQGGDIAVLCRTRDNCQEVAYGLTQLGIPVAIPREGLLTTPECHLALAALRYLISPQDTLAAAELIQFTQHNAPEQWLDHWLIDQGQSLRASTPVLIELDRQRAYLNMATPEEALLQAMITARIDQIVQGWDQPEQRLANLEVLRELAKQYVQQSYQNGESTTPAGLLLFLETSQKNGHHDRQAVWEDQHTVHVLTYHAAKGLEWPYVILADLNSGLKADPFNHVYVEEQEGQPFCFDNPLAGRWLRYWPWPYGKQQNLNPATFNDFPDNSSQAAITREKERAEMLRLLYVGFTRARDYLTLTVPYKNRKNEGILYQTDWLNNVLQDDRGNPLLQLPEPVESHGHNTLLTIGQEETFPIVTSHLQFSPEPQSTRLEYPKPPLCWLAEYEQPKQSPKRPKAHQTPSTLSGRSYGKTGILPAEPIALGGPLLETDHPQADKQSLGEAIHRFLGIDDPHYGHEKRRELAQKILKAWQIYHFPPEALLKASDRLIHFVENRFGQGVWRKEWPVYGRLGGVQFSGQIDLLIELPEGYLIMDHKLFPQEQTQWATASLEVQPQLEAYRALVEKITTKKVVSIFIHLPMWGALLPLE